MEVLEKIYWSILEIVLYVIMEVLFLTTILIIGAKTMFDKYFMKFLEAIDNFFNKIWKWFKRKK